MPVFRGSRYEKVRAVGVIRPGGQVRLFTTIRKPITTDDIGRSFKKVAPETKDVIDLMAFEVGGPERSGWVISDVNSFTDYPDPLEIGSALTVPKGSFLRRL